MNTIYIRGCVLPNLGDTANKILVEGLSDKEVCMVNNRKDLGNKTVYTVIGSVMGWADKNTVVWGTGMLSSTSLPKDKPKKILAVRGPLTRNKLLEAGFKCPKIYGDPFLLMPRVIKPPINKKEYTFGIIPHQIERDFLFPLKEAYPKCNVIDITRDVPAVMEEICKCEFIVSSALHGIICADAYNVPAVWVKFSDRVLGNDFKFFDYFESVSREDKEPIIYSPDEDFLTRVKCKLLRWNRPKIDTTSLMEVCPWRKKC